MKRKNPNIDTEIQELFGSFRNKSHMGEVLRSDVEHTQLEGVHTSIRLFLRAQV